MIDSDYNKVEPFTIIKTYKFAQNEYLFEVDVTIENSVNKAIPLNFENFSYSLAFEPQIGPSFETMSNNNYSYRRFSAKYDGDKKENVSTSDVRIGRICYLDCIIRKYFSVIAIGCNKI